MRAIIKDACIRGHEVKTGKNGNQYVLVRYEEGETGKPQEIVDRDVSRAEYYKRDKIMDILIDIDRGRTRDGKEFVNLKVLDAREVE